MFIYHLYRILSILLLPLIALYIFIRAYRGKENLARIKERFGIASVARPEGRVIWVHAVSVGESAAALTLIAELLKFDSELSILFTTTTLTSAKLITDKLPRYHGRLIHQFLPVDSYFCVLTFLKFWRPRLVLFTESEVWPNLIYTAKKMAISTAIINARISQASYRKWKIARNLGFKIFDYFALIFAQSKAAQKLLADLTDHEVLNYGNLKLQNELLAYSQTELTRLKNAIKDRTVWLASSTHEGEEEIVFKTHQDLKKEFPDLLTILIPRHPNRANQIKQLSRNLKFAQRSMSEEITDEIEIYLADTLGELGLFYCLAPISFIGGSLVKVGGHNPFEAAQLATAIISGNQVFNNEEIYRDLVEANGCIIIDSASALSPALKKLILDKNLRAELAKNGFDFTKNFQNISARIISKLDQLLLLKI